ncbi:ParA family protein [Microbacterium lacus]|uniref:CobQ/CobB/MinD/ParA nucleotide binding domain-containing protein n=1 Tax=Microbacterium lacus TaxID=415217 RepID=A0ABN2FWZ8_9MICO
MTTLTHPRAFATVTGPTATFTTPDGRTEPVTAHSGEDIRTAIVRLATREARRTGAPVELVTSGDRGEHHLLIGITGPLGPLPTTPTHTPELTSGEAHAAPAEGVPAEASGADHALRREVRERAPQPAQDTTPSTPAAELPARPTFLTPTPASTTPTGGWRGVLCRLGIRTAPSRAEQERRARVEVVSRHWAGCRTIAVVNGKGGVGKTMTTAMLAAVFARHGGGGVLAWDNNDTRGTLGWRTQQGRYDTTLRDLLPAAPDLLSPTAGVSEITRFVHHQPADRYDVLRSNPELLATDQRIATPEFDLLMKVAARYYRLVIFDSGNDESADRWLRMIDSSHQLVLPTLAAPESAESAALLLDALRARDARSAALADRAVVIVTESEPSTIAARRIAEKFAGHVRQVEIIPFDPALKSGPLRFEALHRRTQDAWVRAAAATAETL